MFAWSFLNIVWHLTETSICIQMPPVNISIFSSATRNHFSASSSCFHKWDSCKLRSLAYKLDSHPKNNIKHAYKVHTSNTHTKSTQTHISLYISKKIIYNKFYNFPSITWKVPHASSNLCQKQNIQEMSIMRPPTAMQLWWTQRRANKMTYQVPSCIIPLFFKSCIFTTIVDSN